MRAEKIALYAGVAAALGWLTKMVILTLQGGPEDDSVPESVAFVVGLVGYSVAAVALGASLGRSRSTGMRVLLAVVALLAAGVLLELVQTLLTLLPADGEGAAGDAWWQAESAFAVCGVAALGAAAALRARSTRASAPTPARRRG